MTPQPISPAFFDQSPLALARAMLGKVLRHRVCQDGRPVWLSARIIEAEAYALDEKGSHSSLGRTPSRAAMFEAPGTIYMYYARGADSLNFSAKGEGNAVLIKSAVPVVDEVSQIDSIAVMQQLNPGNRGLREPDKLCSGQTLLCRSLDLRVDEWNGKQLDTHKFYLDQDSYSPERIVQCQRLGIPAGRDEHLLYRFVDAKFVRQCTSNPLTKRQWHEGVEYVVHKED